MSMTANEAVAELRNHGIGEDVAAAAVSLLGMYGPFEVRLGAPPQPGGKILTVACLHQGKFEVREQDHHG